MTMTGLLLRLESCRRAEAIAGVVQARNQLQLQQSTPSDFPGQPRDFDELGRFKATGVVLLKEFLDKDAYEHLNSRWPTKFYHLIVGQITSKLQRDS